MLVPITTVNMRISTNSRVNELCLSVFPGEIKRKAHEAIHCAEKTFAAIIVIHLMLGSFMLSITERTQDHAEIVKNSLPAKQQ